MGDQPSTVTTKSSHPYCIRPLNRCQASKRKPPAQPRDNPIEIGEMANRFLLLCPKGEGQDGGSAINGDDEVGTSL